MERKRRIDVNDIIGMTFNGVLVKAYVGDKEYEKTRGVVQKIPMYECECTVCGKAFVRRRQQIKSSACVSCNARAREFGAKHTKESTNKQVNTRVKQSKTYGRSGIKYYGTSIDKATGKTIHRAKVGFKDESGKLITINIYSGVKKEKAITLANKAHELMKSGGKEEFLKWYEEWRMNNA